MLIYEKIKKLAKDKGITITQLEHDLNLPRGNTCKWNCTMPRLTTLRRIAEYFGVSIEYFLEE